MNGGCKYEDSEEISKAIYYYPESCSDIEFSIAVCLSMWTLDLIAIPFSKTKEDNVAEKPVTGFILFGLSLSLLLP